MNIRAAFAVFSMAVGLFSKNGITQKASNFAWLSGALSKAGLAGVLLVMHLIGADAHTIPKTDADTDEVILATKAAMDAFFSIEGATPNGVSASRAPDDFAGGGESELITYLSEQRRHGARWDRYRYLGTLLHHSLRAGFDDVARWLLHNGADPTQRIEDSGLDALGVAVQMERWSLVRPLLRHTAYQHMPMDEVAERLWAGAITQKHRAELLRMRPAVPIPSLGKTGVPLLNAALCSADLNAARGLLAPVTAPISLGAKPDCFQFEEPLPHHIDFKAWQSLEAKLTRPLLPYLLPSMHSSSDLRAALSSGLAQPWSDADFVNALLGRIPHRLLPELLLAGSTWGVQTNLLWPKVTVHQGVELWKLPTAQFEPLVRNAPAEGLFRMAEAGIWGAGYLGPLTPKHWELIVAQLSTLPPADRLGFENAHHLLNEVPPSQFERVLTWMATADKVPEALAPWYYHASAQTFEHAWPVLKKNAPQWSDQLLAAMLTPLSAEPASDRLNKALAPFSVANDALAKAMFLRTQGLSARPRLLASNHARNVLLPETEATCCDAALARWAVKEGLLVLPQQAPSTAFGTKASAPQPELADGTPPQLVLTAAAPDCKPEASPGLRTALATWLLANVSDTDAQRADSVIQPLAAPQQANCQWLHSWTEVRGGGWTNRSFLDGEEYESHMGSIEETLYVTRWDEHSGKMVPFSEIYFATGLVEVELLPMRERFWLTLDSHANGNWPAGAYQIQWQQAKPILEPLPQSSVLDTRWQLVVDPLHVSVALGLLSEEGDPVPDRQRVPREPVPVAEFADAHWAADRHIFLNAFMALERRTLQEQQQAGLFPHWLDAAVLWLGSNEDLSLGQRRARMAWLQANRGRVTALSDAAIHSLINWLPAEDWTPILESRHCSGRYEDQMLLNSVASKANPTLRRRLAVALAKPCQGVVQ